MICTTNRFEHYQGAHHPCERRLCKEQRNVPLEIEHIVARANGGTNRISNLCLACEPCNKRKGTQDIAVFLAKKLDLLEKIQAQAKAPLKDATAVNSTRWALFEQLKKIGLPMECGSGGMTKYNRERRNLPKLHWIDAACVGASTPPVLQVNQIKPLLITANGHGSRQMCLMNEFGFPRSKPKAKHFSHPFQTGDIVKAVVPAHLKHPGVHIGRVAVKAKGGFTISTNQGKVTDIGKRYCQVLQKADGYGYTQKGEAAFPPVSL